ncbi:hypothetical protein RIR_jg12259.t1 [Rhizophagus irregularis DAOM 181602=DAOM 197198]|nr:hypothetical protein RIR_jg12259.t1 [Rhizophagus irregularis DAOM 181602=DAOM 197198]
MKVKGTRCSQIILHSYFTIYIKWILKLSSSTRINECLLSGNLSNSNIPNLSFFIISRSVISQRKPKGDFCGVNDHIIQTLTILATRFI